MCRAAVILSSVDLLGQCTYGRGSSGSVALFWYWAGTTLSKHFIIIGVSATGLLSIRQGTGLFEDWDDDMVSKWVGTVAYARVRLKMEVKSSASSVANVVRACPGMLSG